MRDWVAPRPQHEAAPRLVARRAPSRAARRSRRRPDPQRLDGVAGRLVEGALGAAHVSVLSAEMRGDPVGGAGADSVPVAEASQPLALVRS